MTRFWLTFDSIHKSVTLVAGQKIFTDIAGLTLTRGADGKYDCSLTLRNGSSPLVASSSHAGQTAVERANGKLKEVVPGFVEGGANSSLAEDIARFLGWGK